MNTDAIDIIRRKCWDKAVEAYGTGYIFEKRSHRLRIQIRGLIFLGIVVPVIAGSIVLSFGKVALSPFILIPAGILAAIQVVGSVWSLVARWDDSYSYALESLSSNYRLSENYQKLAENPPDKLLNLQIRFDLIEVEDQFRSTEDNKQGITDKEKRMGMRAALRKFKRKCANCNEIPFSMKPSDCPVCGQF
jgi:mobilome CxxCx(11)CxxC protein